MPGEEGQVEASVKHLKSSFVAPRDLDALGLDGARKELVARLRNVADLGGHPNPASQGHLKPGQ